MSLVLGDCGSETSGRLKNAVKRKTPDSVLINKEKDAVFRKSPDSVLTEEEMDAIERKSPDSVLINKENDAFFRKSPDSDLTEEEMDSLMRNPRPAILTKKQMDAFAAACKKKMFKKWEEMVEKDRDRRKRMEDPDYFSNMTELEASLWELELLEQEIDEKMRAEKEERKLQKLRTQK